MTNLKRFVFVVLLFFTGPSQAYDPDEGNITMTLGPFWSKTDFKHAATTFHTPVFTNFGLVTVGDINNKGSLEIGIFHLNKQFVRTKGEYSIVEQSEMMHITMGYRRWLSSVWSTSLAFFSSYTMGDPLVVGSDFPTGQTIDTSARDITEYGADWALQADLWSQGPYSLIAEARYSLSVTAKSEEKSDHYGFMLGLRYLVQEKNP